MASGVCAVVGGLDWYLLVIYLLILRRHLMMSRYRDSFSNRVLAPEGELLSFAPPRQLLLRCSTSCIHAVEKQVAKEKAARLPLMSCAPRICRGTAKGASCPFAAVRHPCRTPNGLFPTNTPVLDAANGRKARYSLTSVTDCHCLISWRVQLKILLPSQ